MSDRLTPERENEIRGWLAPNSDLWPEEFVCDELYQAGQSLLAALDACRRDLDEERARTTRLTEAVREACLHQGLPADATPESVARHFRSNRELAAAFDALGGAGTEQPA